MKLHIRLLATPLGALIASSCAAAVPTPAVPPPAVTTPMMSAPKPQSVSATAALVSKLTQGRAARGLDNDHGFAVAQQHPGIQGTQVVRAAHTYKGLRVFGSESVVVVDGAGNIVSESASERRLHLGRGAANRLGAATADFKVKPSMPPSAAIDAAVGATLAAAGPDATHVVPPGAELLIYPVMKTERVADAVAKPEEELNALDVQEVVDHYELAYLVRTRMRRGDHPRCRSARRLPPAATACSIRNAAPAAPMARWRSRMPTAPATPARCTRIPATPGATASNTSAAAAPPMRMARPRR
jgi:hypothetical protein